MGTRYEEVVWRLRRVHQRTDAQYPDDVSESFSRFSYATQKQFVFFSDEKITEFYAHYQPPDFQCALTGVNPES
jgi:FPC/CPF motif-containing protein YcgG